MLAVRPQLKTALADQNWSTLPGLQSDPTSMDGLNLPVLVVQGERDPFGRPDPAIRREVVLLPGDHSLKADLAALDHSVCQWLRRQL